MFWKKKEEKKPVDVQAVALLLGIAKKFGEEYKRLDKELQCVFDTTYIDDKGKKIVRSDTKNAVTWIPKILIDINNTLKNINENLEKIANKENL